MLISHITLPRWASVVTLEMTHITIVSVTIFLHRHQAHRALDLHPAARAFLPLLAFCDHRDGDEDLGRGAPHAPCVILKPRTILTALTMWA